MNRSRSSPTLPVNKSSKASSDLNSYNSSNSHPQKRTHFDDINLLETLNSPVDNNGNNGLVHDEFIILPDPIPPLPDTFNFSNNNSNSNNNSTANTHISNSKVYNTRKRTSSSILSAETAEDSSSSSQSSNSNSNTVSGRKPVIPGFVNKLYRMVDDESTSLLIKWSTDGRTFLVLSPEDFSRQVLPLFFKHNNFSSFVRQLNMYGFHKVPHLQQGSMAAASLAVTGIETTVWEFSHENFLQGRPDLLINVRRKILKDEDSSSTTSTSNSSGPGSTSSTLGTDNKSGTDAVQGIRQDLLMIRHQQSALRNDLLSIQRDNQLLWNENLASRERHLQQQQVIDRILRFLATVFTIDGKVIGGHQNIQLPNLQNIQSLQNLNSMSTASNSSASALSSSLGSSALNSLSSTTNVQRKGGPLLIEDVPAVLSDLFINETPENSDIRRQVMELIETNSSTSPANNESRIGVIVDDPSKLARLDDLRNTTNEIEADIALLEDHLHDHDSEEKLKDSDFDFSNYLNCHSLE